MTYAIRAKIFALFIALILSACGGGGGGSSVGGGGEPVSFAPSAAVLPPLQTPAMLADDTAIAIGGGSNTLANLAVGDFPYDGAIEIPATTADNDLASAWRLLPHHETSYENCNGGCSVAHVTLGFVYKADGEKLVASFFTDDGVHAASDIVGASALTFTIVGKNEVNAALGLGGAAHSITLAYYNGAFGREILLSLETTDKDNDADEPEGATRTGLEHADLDGLELIKEYEWAVDETVENDMLIFQNQYSLLSFWLYPRHDAIIPGLDDEPFGLPTPDAQRPNSGSATYAGIAAGYLHKNDDLERQFFFVYGASEFTADFADSSLSGKITVSAYQTPQLENKLGGGDLGGARGVIGIDINDIDINDRFSAGNLSYSTDNNDAALGVFAGFKKQGAREFTDNYDSYFDSNFYGPDAAEIAGNLELETEDESLDLELQFTADKQ